MARQTCRQALLSCECQRMQCLAGAVNETAASSVEPPSSLRQQTAS